MLSVSESVLNQNTIKVYTDGSKLDGRVGAGFYAEYPNNSPKQAFFTVKYPALCPRQKSCVIQKWQRTCFWKSCTIKVQGGPKVRGQWYTKVLVYHCPLTFGPPGIVVLLDSQAAIKSLIKCAVTSITVLNCIRNLNQLGKQNHVSIAWITGHSRVNSNEVADYLAKSGSK